MVRSRAVLCLPVLGLVATALVAPWSGSAVAATAAPIVSLNTVQQRDRDQFQTNVFSDGAAGKVYRASVASGLEVSGSSLSGGSGYNFTITPPPGGSLKPGDQLIMLLPNGTPDPTLPTVNMEYNGFGADAEQGELDIRDLAWDATGQIYRFDISFAQLPGMGPYGFSAEMRMGENEGTSVDLGARTLKWLETPIGFPVQTETEWLHNVGSSAVAIGATSVAGDASADYSVAADSCSGKTLAAGAKCSIGVGFSPTKPGPRDALLNLHVGGTVQQVSLAGQGSFGTSSITTSGSDELDKGTTHSLVAGHSFAIETRPGYVWQTLQPAGGDSIQTIVNMSTEDESGPLLPGVHPTVSYTASQGTGAYGETTFVNDFSCGFNTGSMDVKAFAVDAYNYPTLANITYTQTCSNETAPMTGVLLWHWRSDITPPAAPTAVAVSGSSPRTASWRPSASTDVARTIARLVEGSGAAATPASGLPLSDGTATAATLPALQSNERYTVVVFAVDTSGNTSAAGSTTFTVGTPSAPLALAGPPTNVKAVAGDGSATVSFTPPANDGGSPITGYLVQNWGGLQQATGPGSPITITGLRNGSPNSFLVYAITAVGRGQASYLSNTVVPGPVTPPPPPPKQFLPDPGFESGTGGWVGFANGTATRVSSPVRTGTGALQVSTTSSTPTMAGLTQNSAVSSSVAGVAYSFSCWVQPSISGMNLQARFLEYTQNFSSDIHLPVTTANALPVGVWTNVAVTGTAVKSGERMVPQIYAIDQTHAGAIVYDDCSLTASG
ncbi:fibronectin type III domain-containing protein [Leifsonia sp. NPDC056665]|uniref:fibronectin type III domain-containing protein n=1 Tax=Leifsonia sp. NPDC056665 TaxID=3345901 RepID=UPI0036B9B1BC